MVTRTERNHLGLVKLPFAHVFADVVDFHSILASTKGTSIIVPAAHIFSLFRDLRCPGFANPALGAEFVKGGAEQAGRPAENVQEPPPHPNSSSAFIT
jgi:hypothetical protein